MMDGGLESPAPDKDRRRPSDQPDRRTDAMGKSLIDIQTSLSFNSYGRRAAERTCPLPSELMTKTPSMSYETSNARLISASLILRRPHVTHSATSSISSEGSSAKEAWAGSLAPALWRFIGCGCAIANLAPEERLRPSTPLTVIKNSSPKRLFNSIHAQTGLQVPSKAWSWIGWLGTTTLIAGVLGVLPVGILFSWWALIPAMSIALTFASTATTILSCPMTRFSERPDRSSLTSLGGYSSA